LELVQVIYTRRKHARNVLAVDIARMVDYVKHTKRPLFLVFFPAQYKNSLSNFAVSVKPAALSILGVSGIGFIIVGNAVFQRITIWSGYLYRFVFHSFLK